MGGVDTGLHAMDVDAPALPRATPRSNTPQPLTAANSTNSTSTNSTSLTSPKAAKTDLQSPANSTPHQPPSLRMIVLPHRYTKTLHIIRHGEGFHNVAARQDRDAYRNWNYSDAHLTANGWKQAHKLGEHLRRSPVHVEVVVVSPLVRTLETAVGAFGLKPWQPGTIWPQLMVETEHVMGKVYAHKAVSAEGCPPFVACELCREHIGVNPCDKRRSLTFYKKHFPAVDFSNLSTEEDPWWKPDARETREETMVRAQKFMTWLMRRPEREIAVVSHSGFLHFLLSLFYRPEASTQVQGELVTWFENCEMRTYTVCNEAFSGPVPADALHFPGGQQVLR